MNELGNMLVNYSRIIPAGVVLFFPSYSYMHAISALWQERGVIARIEMNKRVFWESKGCSADEILRGYTKGVAEVVIVP
jgi:chromosome transmission fidelity protein 1